MLRVPYLLNRLVGPFVTGVLAAAVASADGPVSAAILLTVAAPFAFISLPGMDQTIERLLSDDLTVWPSE
jgi:hypothetical protein